MNNQEYERFKAGAPAVHKDSGEVILFVREWTATNIKTGRMVHMIKIEREDRPPISMSIGFFLGKWSLEYQVSTPHPTLPAEALLDIAISSMENEGGVNHGLLRAMSDMYKEPADLMFITKRPKQLRDYITNFSFAEHEAEQKKRPVLQCAVIGSLMRGI